MSVYDIGYPHLKSSQSSSYKRDTTPTIISPIYINRKIPHPSHVYHLDDQNIQRDSFLYEYHIESLSSPLYRRSGFYYHEFLEYLSHSR